MSSVNGVCSQLAQLKIQLYAMKSSLSTQAFEAIRAGLSGMVKISGTVDAVYKGPGGRIYLQGNFQAVGQGDGQYEQAVRLQLEAQFRTQLQNQGVGEAEINAFLANNMGKILAEGLQVTVAGQVGVLEEAGKPVLLTFLMDGQLLQAGQAKPVQNILMRLLNMKGQEIKTLMEQLNALKTGEVGPAGLTKDDGAIIKNLLQKISGNLALELTNPAGVHYSWAQLQEMTTDQLGISSESDWAKWTLGVFDPAFIVDPRIVEQE